MRASGSELGHSLTDDNIENVNLSVKTTNMRRIIDYSNGISGGSSTVEAQTNTRDTNRAVGLQNNPPPYDEEENTKALLSKLLQEIEEEDNRIRNRLSPIPGSVAGFQGSAVGVQGPSGNNDVEVSGLVNSQSPGPAHDETTSDGWAIKLRVDFADRDTTVTGFEDEGNTSSERNEANTAEDDFNKVQCIACMEDQPKECYPEGRITDNCYHSAFICFRCLEYSIASDHRNRMWDDINCPQCYTRLAYEDVKKFADPTTFEHYDELCKRNTLAAVENFTWCTGCPSGQIHEGAGNCPEVVCHSCTKISCYNHKVPWHTGLTCSQYERLMKPTAISTLISIVTPKRHSLHSLKSRRASLFSHNSKFHSRSPSEDEYTNTNTDDVIAPPVEKIRAQHKEQTASIMRIRQVCKKCPGCKLPIQKSDGCKHMTCLKCTYEFCWRCHRSWDYGHKCWAWWT